jgi:chromosome segregation ATPase
MEEPNIYEGEPLQLDLSGDAPIPVGAGGLTTERSALVALKTIDAALEFDPLEIEELAGYGPVPSSFLNTIKYVLKVRQRSAELRTDAENAVRDLEPAKHDLDETLAKLGERTQVAGYRSPQVQKLLGEVAKADQAAANAEVTLEAERLRHQQRIAEIDSDHEQIRTQMIQPRQVEAKLAGMLSAKKEEARQQELRIQRINIELRNAEALITSAENTSLQEEDQEKVADLQRQAQIHRAKLPQLQQEKSEVQTLRQHLAAPIEELTSEHARASAIVAELRTRRAAIAEAREMEEGLHRKNVQAASKQTQEANQAGKTKLAEVGMVVRLETEAPAWAQDLFPEIDLCAERYHKIRSNTARLLQAADAYDAVALRKGYIYLAVSGGGVILGMILLLVALSYFS